MKVTVILVFLALSGGMLWRRFSVGVDLGEDFAAFYLAGKMPPQSLYDQSAFRSAGERWLAPQGVSYFPPYVRPAVFALPLRLLSFFSYRGGFAAWLVLLYASYIAAIAIGFLVFRPPFYVLALFGAFYPAIMGPTVGQDPNFESVIIAASLGLLIGNRDAAAGAVLALGLNKFNLIWLLPLVFLAHARHKAVLAFCACAILLAAASALLSPASSYVFLLQHVRDYTGVPPDAVTGIRGIIPRLYFPLVGAAIVVTYAAIKRLPVEQGFCLATIASYLFAYQVSWYDGAVLTVPLIAAFRRDSVETVIPALFLLLPVIWTISERGTVFALLLLYAAFALPAFKPAFENWRIRESSVHV
jgi:hypothetical protein